MSAWHHLPNAALIDRIIADAKGNPQAWGMAGDVTRETVEAAYTVTRRKTVEATYTVTRNAAWTAARDAAWDAAWDAAREGEKASAATAASVAVVALVAWDHAGGLLDLPAEQVHMLALLGDAAAILMYSAVLALQTEKEFA